MSTLSMRFWTMKKNSIKPDSMNSKKKVYTVNNKEKERREEELTYEELVRMEQEEARILYDKVHNIHDYPYEHYD